MTRTVLLVDDEVEIGSALERLLRRDAYQILRATSSKEGMALLAEHDIGVIIADQRMPEMSGVEFLTQVKELYPHTMRIMLSGYADLGPVMEAINRGAIYRFFTKPWDNAVLAAEVQEAFRHRELALENNRLVHDLQSANDQLAQVNLDWEAALAYRDSEIERLTHYHPLTGLPNRQLFQARLERSLLQAQREQRMVAVMLLDLDRFAQVNHSFGHHAGDALLQLVASRLRAHAAAVDSFAHLGEDEFGFVLSAEVSARGSADFAQKLLDSIGGEPFAVAEQELFVSGCLGISLYPVDGVDAHTLFKKADAALHHAKAEGRGGFQFFETRMSAGARKQLSLETELHHALERGEFILHYQPKVEAASGNIVGMEALLRWNNQRRGLVSPGEFIPLLEETGLMLAVGEWVLDSACRQARAWQQAGLHTARISINISTLQFRQPDLLDTLRNIIEKNGLGQNTALIELELTESMLMKHVGGAGRLLGELREMGIRLSIDDFGTGYSSLGLLKQLPVTSLKIDRTFVVNLPHNRQDGAIVNAIIALAHGLGLSVIAEGVENDEQLEYLQAAKCDEVQGYLFCRPAAAEEMTRLLQSGASLNISGAL